MNVLAVLLSAVLSLAPVPDQDPGGPLWMRYPAVSPDGTRIAFAYLGDIWVVPSGGGEARQLTRHPARDYRPVWSPDGSQIAFASDRFGNFDVFLMPSGGGEATRLTYHSAPDEPTAFTPSGDEVLFSSPRLDDVLNVQFPIGVLPELYAVSTSGHGTPRQVLTTPAIDAVPEAGGTRLVYHDQKGYEDPWRKHHVSAVARDVWLYDAADGTHTKLTDFGGEDRNPVWAPGRQDIWYLSERSGSFNVWRMPLSNPGAAQQVTHHDRHPVRFLTASNAGDLLYFYDGEIYRLPAVAAEPARVPITIHTERGTSAVTLEQITDGATEFAVSPDGKEIAFVVRGEVFVTSVAYPTTKRITNTPEQERSVSFSPDGRSILYASERGDSWGVYETSIRLDEERSFSQSTLLDERVVVNTSAEEFQPLYSPDGTEVAYLEDRVVLKVVPRAGGQSRTILTADHNVSYSDGDQWYRWSDDGTHFLVTFAPQGTYQSEVGLVSAAGGDEPVNLTLSGYFDANPRWMSKAQGVGWVSDRLGLKPHNDQGGAVDVFGMFFTREALDRFDMTKEEREAAKANGDDEDDSDAAGNDGDGADDATPAVADIDLDGIEDRIRRLTIHSAEMADFALTPDLTKLVYLARFEEGYDLWLQDFVERDTKVLAKIDASDQLPVELRLSEDGKTAFVLANRRISQVALADGATKPIAFAAEMTLDRPAERAYLFEHIWRQVKEKFYVADLHGVDWDYYKARYGQFLPHINNEYDFQEMLSELLGELNASHTGARYRPRVEDGDETASLGVFFDQGYRGDGLRIAEVIGKGPLSVAESRAGVGTVLTEIDGESVADHNYYGLLNRKAGKTVLLTLRDPGSGEEWHEHVDPISLRQENQLLYERWVESRRAEVDRLSGGRLGYVHIRAMNNESFRETYAEMLGRNIGKEAVVVDTRFNGGGNLHDQLVTFLSGERYMDWEPRGRSMGGEPIGKWQKPTIVVMSESNYSDAHIFPWAYKDLGVGELVGMPVPGTGTAVWWETLQTGDLIFGIPQWGVKDRRGEFLENHQLEPDYKVENDPESVAQGRDKQLEKAVEVLLTKVGRKVS